MKRFQQLKYRYLEKYLQCEISMELDLSFEQFLMIQLEGFEAAFHNMKFEEDEEE